MQQRPSLTQLLDAVSSFLSADLAASIDDRALRFRVLIAAHLTRQISAELTAQDRLLADETAATAKLLARQAPAPTRAALAGLDDELARQIREGELDGDALVRARDHLLTSYAAYLEATDPNFDLSETIE